MSETGQTDTTESPSQLDLAYPFSSTRICKPFLKWVGGKSKLIPDLVARMPQEYNRYFEPFMGGAALFFHLCPKDAYLSDVNPELLNTYSVVKKQVAALVEDLKGHRYEREYFYRVRNADRSKEFAKWSAVERASRFIYLNKTCFNGLCRVNSKGHFNTPFGRYNNPKILDEKNLRACSRALKTTKIIKASFLKVEEHAKKGDFVYFDPPYVPLSATANFTTFSRSGFGLEMQQELKNLCDRLTAKRVKFMLSNSAAPLIFELFTTYNIHIVRAPRAINSAADKRGKIDEVLVTNY